MVQITHVRVREPANGDADITDVRWYDPRTGSINVANLAGMVEFIRNGGQSYTCDGNRIRLIEVVNGHTPYIRLTPDPSAPGSLSDLPKF
jgi:hypothetical protein